MLFSYGFIEEPMENARSLFLDLSIPDDDPLKQAKLHVSKDAPGVRVFQDGADTVSWESDFVWIVCVNEEDGFDFKIEQTVQGGRELKAFWKDDELPDTSALRSRLESDRLWPVFLLRAACLVLDRVEAQIERLATSEPEDEVSSQANIREGPGALAMRLRSLERKLLEEALHCLSEQVRRLLPSQSRWSPSSQSRHPGRLEPGYQYEAQLSLSEPLDLRNHAIWQTSWSSANPWQRNQLAENDVVQEFLASMAADDAGLEDDFA
jgi:hypothetical protein